MIRRIMLWWAKRKVERYSNKFDRATIADKRSEYRELTLKWLKRRDKLLDNK